MNDNCKKYERYHPETCVFDRKNELQFPSFKIVHLISDLHNNSDFGVNVYFYFCNAFFYLLLILQHE